MFQRDPDEGCVGGEELGVTLGGVELGVSDCDCSELTTTSGMDSKLGGVLERGMRRLLLPIRVGFVGGGAEAEVDDWDWIEAATWSNMSCLYSTTPMESKNSDSDSGLTSTVCRGSP